MQHHAAHDLHGEVTHIEHAVGCLAADGKGIWQDIIQRFAVCIAFFELRGHSSKFCVAHLSILVLQSENGLNDGVDPLQLPVAMGAENFI